MAENKPFSISHYWDRTQRTSECSVFHLPTLLSLFALSYFYIYLMSLLFFLPFFVFLFCPSIARLCMLMPLLTNCVAFDFISSWLSVGLLEHGIFVPGLNCFPLVLLLQDFFLNFFIHRCDFVRMRRCLAGWWEGCRIELSVLLAAYQPTYIGCFLSNYSISPFICD